MIEPIALVAYSEDFGDDDIPNEDSRLPEFDETNLFSLSRFPGEDRLETGLRANLGVSYTRQDPSGWSLGATLGRVIRAEAVDDFAEGTGLAGKWSDYVGAVSFEVSPGLALVNRSLFDESLDFRRNEFALAYDSTRTGLRAAYVYLAEDNSNAVLGPQPETSELALDARYRFHPNWEVRGLWRYDIATDTSLRAGAAVTYGNECAEFDLSVSRRYTSSSNLPASTSIGLACASRGSATTGSGNGRRAYAWRGAPDPEPEGGAMRRVAIILAIMMMAAAAPAQTANPYAPAITVNDGVITRYDIEQRIRLLDALGAAGDLRELAIEQLTEDRVKKQAAAALGIELPEGAIDAGIEEFATTRGIPLEDVFRILEARDIDRQTMNDFVESGLLWREVITQRFRARATPSETDLDAALELAATTPREMLTLAEIALPFAELGEVETQELADTLYRQIVRGEISFADAARSYSRSSTAPQGGTLEPVPADRLPASFRTQVLLLGPGETTRPIPIAGGLALIRLVSVDRVRPDAAPDPEDPEAREALRQQLFTERITSFGQGYLQELIGDALIVER